VRYADGSVAKLAMIIDISGKKHAEYSLNRKIEEQELLLDNIRTQIWYLTDIETYGAVNKARAEFLGLEKEEMERKTTWEMLSREEAEICHTGNRRVFEEKVQIRTEEWAVNHKGEKRLLSITKTPSLGADGKVAFVVCSGVDITDYRNIEESLRRHQERLDLALEATNDALWDLNLVTGGAYLSPRFYSMLEYDPDERAWTLDDWKSLVHREDVSPFIDFIEESAASEIGKFDLEYRLKTGSGGWRWIRARGKVVERDENGMPVRKIGTHVDITDRKLRDEAIRVSEARLREENIRLRSSLKGADRFGAIIGKSGVMQEVYELILKAAQSDANVIIYGASGVGKELVAQTIHELSDRGSRNFITVNCGAIPDNLLESEFFGYKKGAFTGAEMDKPGYLDAADGGALFLDEIGELDLNMQVKLLRAVDGGGYTPVGGRGNKIPDIRIIAATNRDLKESVSEGRMRGDFYYRIHIIPIHLPPLRERKEDIPLLIHHFLQMHGDENSIQSIPENVMKAMQDYDWPGNVRELQNAVHQYITLKEVDFIDAPRPRGVEENPAREHLARIPTTLDLRSVMTDFEKRYLEKVLMENHWRRTRAASALGINRRTLFRKIREHGLK
ncbi:MAG: PAS domain-containing protein, partial [Desulfobacterales bacterium]|nr:PAS domain-containing protein [Desulfobacterales bacterium]